MKVGNGRQISINKDPWLPDRCNAFISTSLPEELSSCTMHDIMVREGSHWDVDLIQDMFNERDQQLIMSIPCSYFPYDDCWTWR